MTSKANARRFAAKMVMGVAALCFVFSRAEKAFADPDSDAVAKEAGRAAAEAYARESVRTYLDGLSAAKSAAAAGGAAPPGMGTVALNLVDLGISLKDLSEAKTDKGKFHAGARASVAVYALAGGPAAPAIALGLTVAMTIEAGMDSSHQKKMLEIYKRIEEDNKRTLEIYGQLALSEAISLQTLYLRAVGASANVESTGRYLQDNCAEVSAIDTLAKLDGCLLAMADALTFSEMFLATSDEIFSWKGQYISGEGFLKAMPTGTSDTLHAYRDAYSKVVDRTREGLEALRGFYLEQATEILLSNAKDYLPRQEAVVRACLQSFESLQSGVVRNNSQLELASIDTTRTRRCDLKAPLKQASEAIEQFPLELCEAAREFSTNPARRAVINQIPEELRLLASQVSQHVDAISAVCP